MPSGQTSTARNQLPIYVDDDTRLGSLGFSGSGPGTTAPTVRNYIPRIIKPAGVATTLTAVQSGAVVFWDAAAGFTLTLPAPVIGLNFRLIVSTSVTSSNHKVITDAGTTFLLGEVLTYTTATASPAGFAFNGTTHVACTMNGTTTGGLIGTVLDLVCFSSTQWLITGTILGSGTIATPAATS